MLTQLEQLEKISNDDFHLLEAVGPGEFSTSHLLELREQVMGRLNEFDRRKKINVMIGGTTAGWVIAFTAAYLYQNIWLAFAAVVGLLLSLTAFIAGVWVLSRKYSSRGELEYSLQLIDNELSRR